MSLAQLLNGVKSGVSMLAAGVGLEGVDVDFQLVGAHAFGKLFQMRFFGPLARQKPFRLLKFRWRQ